ncbi:MAG TPA: hypothetical protein DHV94_03300 [Clostridiales bacterium]|nr:hypothetical protein [Clostridiales bacterium]HCJ88420.1 hypothetical protein [Clostridiales bacterium]
MKTSWLNGSKRILSALLIAAALMFGWTPLGEGKALAATDKGDDLGQQFADAAMLFVRENNYYLNLCNNQNTPFFYRGSWCATFVSVVARQMGIPTSLIPSSTFADDYGPDPSTRITGFHPYHESSADYSTATPAYDYSSLYHKGDSLYVPEPGDIITIAYKSMNHRVSHVGIVCSVNGTSVTWVSGNYIKTVTTATSQLTPALQNGYYIVGFFHPNWESVMGPLNWRKPNPITGISLKDDSGNVISNKSISIGVHDSQLVEATVTPSNAFWNGNIYRWGSTGLRTVPGWEGLVWQSDNPKVASVNLYTGLITGVSEGTAHITAYAIADGKKKSSNAVKATVTVNVLPQSTNQYIACKITTNNLNIRSKRSAANPLYVVGTLKQDDVIYINPNDVKTVDNITWIYGYKADGTAGYFNRAYCDWDGSVTNSAHYSDYIIDDTWAIVVYAAPHYENKIDELTSADGVFQIDVANMVFYDASGVNTYWAPCRYTKNGKTIEGYIEVLADPPTPCGIDREGDWKRYEVTNAAGAKSIRYPATFELSELSSYDQGEIIWLDRNERVTITENGKQYTFMRGHGDDFVAGWFDVTNVNEPLTQVDDSIEEVVSVRSGASVYTFCRGNVSWAQAAQYAASMGGHLVVIDNAQEDAMLHSTIMSAYGGTAWTGGHANGAGNGWTWLNNNTMSYQNWGSSSATPTSSHTALAIKGDYEGWFTYRDCANPYVDSFIVEVEETPRAWFTYRTKAKLNIRKSQSISGAVATTTAVGDYLTIDLLNVAMDSNKKYFFAPVLMSDGSILYCNIGDKTAIVPDLEPDEPAWTQYKALSSLYVRAFPNTWCDTGVLKTLSKDTILELDVSHKLRDPRFGNDWAYARYKQSDGTYLYGWVIAADTYVEQVKQTPAWYDYFANPGSTVYVYRTQNVDDTIVKTYTSGSSFQVDVNNTRQDQNGYFWAPVADSTGKELGYIDLSAAHAGSKSAAIPLVYCQSGWMPAYVLAEDGVDVLAAPNDAAALVKHMDRDAYFWFGADETYTDAKGKIWTRIYAAKDYEEMADGGWVRLENGVNYNTVYAQWYDTGCSISRNGITYTLYGGYNSWGGASSWFSDGIDFNDGTAVRKHLAIVHNDAEQKIIEQLLNATSTIDKAWIGASNTSGSWRWVDGTNVQYSQWGYNEPSGTGTELGVAASFDGSWYAHDDALDIHIQGFITEQFTGIGLPQVKLPASTFYVDDEAFVGNSTIQSVVAPDGLQVIGTRAFADCANLKCITLPDSVSHIAEDAFENTPDVVIFASVGSYAWQWAEEQGIPHGTPYTE